MEKYYRLEKAVSFILGVISLSLTLIWGWSIIEGADGMLSMAVHLFFLLAMTSGFFLYFAARWGYFCRLQGFKRASITALKEVWKKKSSITFLLPSYKEDIPVIRQSLLSSAFQLYSDKRVVLLIDDPPSNDPALMAAKELTSEVQALVDEARKIVEEEGDCSRCHQKLAAWFLQQGNAYVLRDHTDVQFVEMTFYQRAALHEKLTETLEINRNELLEMFKATITYFERKIYQNLSQASNKAMNLNSYIALMGKQFREELKSDGLHLIEDPHGELVFPDTDFVAMLDADTVLDFEYAPLLLHKIQQPGMEKCAVIQTPYSAFKGAPGTLERIAGATTDMQYIVHQGFTYFGATFWVGANAIARKGALEAIREDVEERGYVISRYIHDRTVIEDTESSIDLAHQGYSLYNYPERLSYSATPPDFGALLIQRRRWANGGLLILPKLFKMMKGAWWKRLPEALMRIHYLGSIAFTVFAFLLLLVFPFGEEELGMFSLFTPIPYLLLYGWDMVRVGYKWSDLPKVMALNFALLPVNLAGVCKSLEQAWTGEQIPFCRTPKIQGKTLVPKFYQSVLWLQTAWVAIAAALSWAVFPLVIVLPNLILTACIAYAMPVFVIGLERKRRDLNPRFSFKNF